MLTLVCGETRRHRGHIDYDKISEGLSQLGQFEQGRFFCQRSQSEDVVVATNNDHVFNAIRVGVKQGVLKPGDVRILFYRYDIDQVDSPQMCEGGRIDYWPDGFFDQWDKALNLLLD